MKSAWNKFVSLVRKDFITTIAYDLKYDFSGVVKMLSNAGEHIKNIHEFVKQKLENVPMKFR